MAQHRQVLPLIWTKLQDQYLS